MLNGDKIFIIEKEKKNTASLIPSLIKNTSRRNEKKKKINNNWGENCTLIIILKPALWVKFD